MAEQIVAESKEEAVEICVSHFRSYELLAFNPACKSEDADRYASLCGRLLAQYGELIGHRDLVVAHKTFTSTH